MDPKYGGTSLGARMCVSQGRSHTGQGGHCTGTVGLRARTPPVCRRVRRTPGPSPDSSDVIHESCEVPELVVLTVGLSPRISGDLYREPGENGPRSPSRQFPGSGTGGLEWSSREGQEGPTPAGKGSPVKRKFLHRTGYRVLVKYGGKDDDRCALDGSFKA